MDERRLTLGEHLEELRAHMIRALLWVFVSCGVCLFFQETLLRVVLWPQRRLAIEQAVADPGGEGIRALQALDEALAEVRGREPDAVTAGARARIGERLARVRATLVQGPQEALAFLSPPEAFLAYLKVAVICGLFISAPFAGSELWGFIAAGLHEHEQRWVKVFAPLSYFCFVAGALFGYFVLIPITLSYLETYGARDLVVPSITLDAYLDVFLALTLALGLVFEVPLAVVFVALIGLVDVEQLVAFRRYFVLIATIAAALITPTGDPLTLGITAIPIILLYELGLRLARIVTQNQQRTP